MVYYNEFDSKAAAWLRELINDGLIAHGEVDERSIEDVLPSDVRRFTQCHWFAGIGVWSSALRGAGWPDDRRVWTGSCPCQPFSQAGKGAGVDDERHLWPAFFHLIQHGKPPGVPVFGEQVASKDGLAWLDLVQDDMEGAGYAFWPVDLSASGSGAPHIRQRLFFVARADGVILDDSIGSGSQGLAGNVGGGYESGWVGEDQAGSASETSAVDLMADAGRISSERRGDTGDMGEGATGDERARREWQWIWDALNDGGTDGVVADPGHSKRLGRDAIRAATREHEPTPGTYEGSGEGGTLQAWEWPIDDPPVCSPVSGVGDAQHSGRQHEPHVSGSDAAGMGPGEWEQVEPCKNGPSPERLADTDSEGEVGRRILGPGEGVQQSDGAARERLEGLCTDDRPSAPNGIWGAADWLFCRDNKWRPVEPGTSPLAPRIADELGRGKSSLGTLARSNRKIRLKGYGNSINREIAMIFIEAAMPAL